MPPFIFDGHTDVPMRLLETPADLTRELGDRHIDLPRLRRGGVGGLVFALYLPASLGPEAGLRLAERLHTLSCQQLAPGGLVQVTSVKGILECARRGEVGVLFGLENGRPLILPGALEILVARGVRLVTLTHVGTHEWCDAAGDEEVHGGLAPAGVEIVRQLNEHGVVVDVSHVSDRAAYQAVEVSRAPVVASHSSARALCDHPRNLPDELAREIVRGGGVVMVNAFPAFIDSDADVANRQRLEELREPLAALQEAYADAPAALGRAFHQLFAGHPLPAVPLERYLDHIVYLLELVGEEGVGIGTDFDGISETPVGFAGAEDFPALVAGLEARGVDAAAREAVLAGNFLRVLAQVEAEASRSQ